MQVLSEYVPHLENFFQLNFLFSGLEVSSTAVFIARFSVLLVFGTGVLWVAFRIVMKALDCLQTFLATVGPLPKSFFLLLLLVIPLSSQSIGAQWIGYIVLVTCLVGLATAGVVMLVLWKYGVDQALRLINNFRSRSAETQPAYSESAMPPENDLRPCMSAPTGADMEPVPSLKPS